MNIKEAKEQIRNAIIAYSTCDQYGRLLVPLHKQRPIFMIGAPGIGKTAIMEQLAQEMDLALVSYSMTHHTRQSSLGLPYIVEKEFGGKKMNVTEYTMSEIIASVYDAMEKTGKDRGILFLDEINCVSETLAPAMLQFLQYKTFGRHQVPAGWIIVTAGNPPEYNNSVKEYDIAIYDRLKKIEVEANYEVWKEFAVNTQVHPSVTSYLDIKPNHFYSIKTTVDGKQFVTARAWDDLSEMIKLYEHHQMEVDGNLIAQYLQDTEICKDFTHYYSLFHKYSSDYEIDTILDGTVSEEIKERAQKAKFDERLSLIALIISSFNDIISTTTCDEETITRIVTEIKPVLSLPEAERAQAIEEKIDEVREEMERKEKAQALSVHDERVYLNLISKYELLLQGDIKETLLSWIADLKSQLKYVDEALDHVFTFFEEVCKDGQEMVILVTEMTLNQVISHYIYKHGCEKYYVYNKQLLFESSREDLLKQIDQLDLLNLE